MKKLNQIKMNSRGGTKSLKQIETWSKNQLAPVLLSKYESGNFDHLGINGAKEKYGEDYWSEVKFDLNNGRSIIVNLIPRGAGTRGFGGYFQGIITINLYHKTEKKIIYCCELKHHIVDERYIYFDGPSQEMIDAVINGLSKSILKTEYVQKWNENSKDINGGKVSVAVNIKNKSWNNVIKKYNEESK